MQLERELLRLKRNNLTIKIPNEQITFTSHSYFINWRQH